MYRADVAMADHRSGFILSGPSTNICTVNGERTADGIYCAYPALKDGDATGRTLGYVPDTPDVILSDSTQGDSRG
jgi:hypothetical protein